MIVHGRANENWDVEDDDPLDFFGGESRRTSSRGDDEDSGGGVDEGFEKALAREFAGIGLKESTATAAASGRLR